jgi:hypothetical protein
MQTKTKTIALFAIVAATLAFVAVAPSLINSASARITQETTPPTCTNHNGDVIGSNCPGSSSGPGQGHTFTPGTTTCNHNPSSTTSCPPGQNK